MSVDVLQNAMDLGFVTILGIEHEGQQAPLFCERALKHHQEPYGDGQGEQTHARPPKSPGE